jgi:hypothetical protein
MTMQPSPSIQYFQLPNQYFTDPLPIGRRLIILGESTKGSFYNPTPVSSINAAQTLFGDGPLVDRFTDATVAAQQAIYLMRIEPQAFQLAFGYLEKFPFDLIYVDGLYYNTSPDLIQAFIDFAKEKEYQGQLIHGFFDLESMNTMEDYRNLYPSILNLSIPVEVGIEETGKYFSIVADQFQDRRAGAVYAGLVSSLDPEKSPVNKPLNVTLKQEFQKDEILELRSAGIVCFKNSLKKGVVCTSSSCAVATEDSPHKHISNFRIAQYLIEEIAAEQDKLIGKIGIAATMSDVENLVESILSEYVLLGRIKTGAYTITSDDLNGIIYTTIEIVPVFSVYQMSSTTQVRVRQ